MTLILMVARSIFLICLVLYIYYFTRRKKHDVIIQMWSSILIGMLAGLISQLAGVKLGNVSWNSIQISFYLYCALIVYSLWRLLIESKRRRH
jgi:hypothetical protein